ncbi:proteasome assembly chaperone family protein [Nocardioides caldifontis]|uniref:proteasome assembly chaperone family protein n=1 Tax=Nocardioides caldifontis TaxID=2588938 RepID=UPI0011DF9823|nr:PAC2 family protein [Nocardioides caldifontis]
MSEHVHIVDDVPELDGGADPAAPGPVLLVALDGFLDAGNAGRIAVDHLLGIQPDEQGGKVVASFEIDAFYDYRARRPAMAFVEDHYEGYVAPRLVARLQTDAGGTPYLLMHGPEPDTHWEAFARAVREVVEHFRVRLVVFMGAVPMAVPHSRPVMVTNHATRSELLMSRNVWRGVIRIPASAMSMLEQRLGEWGHDATGFVAHVPHYVAQGDYPAAAVKLLECLEVVTGLQWQLEELQTAAVVRSGEIAQQVAESPEVGEVVAGLEQQYDAFARAAEEGPLPLAEEQELPTAEELGAEFERFLASQAESEDD